MTTPFPFVSGAVLTAAQLNDITNLPINDQTASYTLVVGDAGKRVIMNNAGATTITVDDSIFSTGDTIFIANKGAGTTTITAGAGVTINTAGSLALAQYGGGTLVALSASTFTFFSGAGATYGTATGGTSSSITVGGVNYTLLTFSSTGTLTVTKNGLFDFYCAAGGGCGGQTSGSGGGGGAGGVVSGTVYLTANQTITIGGGAATSLSGTTRRGSDSRVGTTGITAVGGGCGQFGTASNFSSIGGSCGGSNRETQTLPVLSQGNNGGGGQDNNNGAGGGGGSSAAGATTSSTTGGAGGAGLDISTWLGQSAGTTYLAGGGGGHGSATGGAGGSGGGGAGASGSGAATSGTVNTGGGGGGSFAGTSGAGGSGIVYVRFKV